LPFSDKYNIIPDYQFGFKAKHSTAHQLLCTDDLIFSSMESKNKYAVLDVAQVLTGCGTRLKNFPLLRIIFLLSPTLKIKLFQFE